MAPPGAAALPAPFFREVAGRPIECRWHPPIDRAAPTLVFLHDGIGSIAMWRDFPERLAAATGCAALVYSRRGNGWSAPRQAPFAADYMHREAFEALPDLLDGLGIAEPLLIGHSDGASIALVYAGGGGRPVRGVIVEAPHLFVENLTIASIERARQAFRTTALPEKLAAYHADPAMAFFGWNDIWLSPAFRSWNIEDVLAGVTCPVLAIQGADDEYGTPAQIAALKRGVAGPCRTLILPACGHTPHREQFQATFRAMRAFIAACTPAPAEKPDQRAET